MTLFVLAGAEVRSRRRGFRRSSPSSAIGEEVFAAVFADLAEQGEAFEEFGDAGVAFLAALEGAGDGFCVERALGGGERGADRPDLVGKAGGPCGRLGGDGGGVEFGFDLFLFREALAEARYLIVRPQPADDALAFLFGALPVERDETFENFLAGIFIMARKKMRIGDYIKAGDIEGTVEMIRLRDTHIRKLSRELLIVPNTHMFKNTLEIITDESSRRHEIVTGVAYHTDLETAREVIRKAVSAADGVDTERPVDVLATQFNDSSIDFTVRWWSGSSIPDMLNSRDSVVRRIKIALDKAEIEIPFPQVTHNFREPIRVESEGKT